MSHRSDINTTELRNDFYAGLIFYFEFDNLYFDFNDLETPVKHISYQRQIHIQSNDVAVICNVYIRKNEYSLSDSIWQLFSNDEEKGVFYSIEKIEVDYKPLSIFTRNLLEVNLVPDDLVNIYNRRVLSFLEVTGILGGIFEVLEIF